MSTIFISNASLQYCDKILKTSVDGAELDLMQYCFTRENATMFFHILQVLPLLETSSTDSEWWSPLFAIITENIKSIGMEKCFEFAIEIGCEKMADFMIKYYSKPSASAFPKF